MAPPASARVGPGAACVLVAALFAGCVPDRPVRLSGGGDVCRPVVEALVRSWGLRGIPRVQPSDGTGRRTLRIPVGGLGEWVVWRTGPGGSLVWGAGAGIRADLDRLARSTGAGGPSCVTLPAESASVEGRGGVWLDSAFTDEDLDSMAVGERPSVVYVWSPHMPLSVDGYREIETASQELGLAVEPVLFTGANRDFARREARRGGIPARGLRELASLELAFRDVLVHAPSIIVIHGGRLSPVLPGYRDAHGYRRYLETLLGP